MVGRARRCEDHAAVGERRRAGEVVGEEADEREVVRVDGREGGGPVRRVAHHVREAVKGEEELRARMGRGRGRAELGPEGEEDGVRDLWVGGAEEGEPVEGDVGLEGGGEGGVREGEAEGGEDGVGAREAGEEGGGVGLLVVEGRGGAGEGTVLRVADGEVLACGSNQRKALERDKERG